MTANADAMNAIYRHQRFIYDITRRPYLFGRDRMLAAIEPPPCGSVLEIGCGTARNLLRAARLYPDADFYGIDVSAEMLKTANAAVARSPFRETIRLAEGDASSFCTRKLFGLYAADRILISYALSMIPEWEKVLEHALTHLEPRGELHIVDFGSMNGLPSLSRRALRAWLRHFSVTPRLDLADVATKIAFRHGREAKFSEGRFGYAAHVRIGQREPDGKSPPMPQRLVNWLS